MWYDLLTLAILVYTTARGAAKGIVWQLAAIAALILCFAFAEPLSTSVAPYIRIEPPLNRWVAMLGLYLGFSFVSFAAARTLRDWIEKAQFVEYDRHVGAVFGFIKGAVMSLVLTFFVVTLSINARDQIFQSYSGYAAAIVMDRLHPVMPAELHSILEPYIHQLDRSGMDLQHSHDDDHGNHVDDDHTPIIDFGGQEPTPHPPHESLEEMIARLPGMFDDNLREAVRRALLRTDPTDRPALLEKLKIGIPGLMRIIANEWKNGKPAPEPTGSNSRRTEILKTISGVYSENLEAQATIVEDVELALTGLPDHVAMAVLDDWHSDLLVLDPDPDAGTDSTTSLDDRIQRQLAHARVPVTTLSEQWQERLR